MQDQVSLNNKGEDVVVKGKGRTILRLPRAVAIVQAIGDGSTRSLFKK